MHRWKYSQFLLGFFIGTYIPRLVKDVLRHEKSLCNDHSHFKHQTENPDPRLPKSRGFMLVGVITTAKYLSNRSLVANRTWSDSIDGDILHFIGNNERYAGDIPVIHLKVIDDNADALQFKMFVMLQYMHDNFNGEYEWFVCTHDDVYINGARLEIMLRSIDSTKPLYMGHPGEEEQREKEALGIKGGAFDCISGPGIIFSKAALDRLAPHVSDCSNHLLYFYEGVELERCLQKQLNLTCTVIEQTDSLFVQSYAERDGSFRHALCEKEEKSITLHPVTDIRSMYRQHNIAYSIKVKDLREKQNYLYHQVLGIDRLLKTRFDQVNVGGKTKLEYQEVIPELQEGRWDYLDVRDVYSISNLLEQPKQDVKIHKLYQHVMDDVTLLKNVTDDDIQFDTKDFVFAYCKTSSIIGKEYRTVFVKNITSEKGKQSTTAILVPFVRKYLPLEFYEVPESIYSDYTCSHSCPIVTIVTPVLGRSNRLKHFLDQYVSIKKLHVGNISLVLVLHKDPENEHVKSLDFINNVIKNNSHLNIILLRPSTEFNRAPSLSIGISAASNDSIILVMDVDMVFTVDYIRRTRINTIKGKQIYFPVTFTEFSPEIICYEHAQCDIGDFDFRDTMGMWRYYGFGMLGIYKSDYLRIGGYNTRIAGWGAEDTDFFEESVKFGYSVFRVPDSELIHVYHEKYCSKKNGKYRQCLSTKSTTYGSQRDLSKRVYSNLEIYNRTIKG